MRGPAWSWWVRKQGAQNTLILILSDMSSLASAVWMGWMLSYEDPQKRKYPQAGSRLVAREHGQHPMSQPVECTSSQWALVLGGQSCSADLRHEENLSSTPSQQPLLCYFFICQSSSLAMCSVSLHGPQLMPHMWWLGDCNLNGLVTLTVLPWCSVIKNLPAEQETWVRSLGQGDSPGERNGNPLQYSCLGNPMDRGAWHATVHGVAKSWTQLSNWAHATIM